VYGNFPGTALGYHRHSLGSIVRGSFLPKGQAVSGGKQNNGGYDDYGHLLLSVYMHNQPVHPYCIIIYLFSHFIGFPSYFLQNMAYS
jgi:hypothetical protein